MVVVDVLPVKQSEYMFATVLHHVVSKQLMHKIPSFGCAPGVGGCKCHAVCSAYRGQLREHACAHACSSVC